MFETNLRDERYLPFENLGAVSQWQLQLPADPSKGEPCQFDYETISDVILHIRYTAREGGGLLRKGAKDTIKALMGDAEAPGSVRFFSMRHDFPSEWAQFQNQKPAAGQRFALTFTLREEHYPFWGRKNLNKVDGVGLYALSTTEHAPVNITVFGGAVPAAAGTPEANTPLSKDTSLGDLLVGQLGGDGGIALPANPIGEVKLFFEDTALDDLWVAVQWNS